MESYNIYPVNPRLSPYISYYWALETGCDSGLSERVIPFGNMQLVFHRENRIFSSSQNEYQPLAFVGGMSNGYTDLSWNGRIKMFVVAFRPEGARAFLNIPLHLFHNNNISVDDLEDKSLKELGKQLRSEGNDSFCIRLIEDFFLKRLTSFDTFNFRRILPAVHLINKDTTVTISSLPNMACLSQKQFNRVFTEYVGATPKEFQRVVRFQRALFILQNDPTMSLTQLAYEAGYYDQPHLIKDFKQFSGYTPGEFLGICDPQSEYFTYQ